MRRVIWKKNELFFNHAEVFGISFDSRTVEPGDMFFAFKAERDGHDYVKEAIAKGAVCAIVERRICEKNVVVQSVMETLQKIAIKRRAMLKADIIGITGSVGKTTSREALAYYLKKNGNKVYQCKENYNNLLGVCYTLFAAPLDADYLIIEIGTNSAGEVNDISEIVKPDYSLITHIGVAHIGMFGTMRNILFEKMDIIKHTKRYCFFCENYWFTNSMKTMVKECGIDFTTFKKGASGMETLRNAWEVVLNYFDVQMDDSFQLLAGRRKVFKRMMNGYEITVIDSSYNASVDAMVEEIKNLQNYDKPKMAILADMNELGKKARRFHELLSLYLKGVKLILIGPNMKFLALKMKDSVWFENSDGVMQYFKNNIDRNYVILVKGSVSWKMPKIVEAIKNL